MYTWAADHAGFSERSQGYTQLSSGDDIGLANYQPADLNGDGKMDLVYFLYDIDQSDVDYCLQFALSDGEKLVPTPFANGDPYYAFGNDSAPTLKALDYNGDGRQDVAVKSRSANSYLIFLSEPQADGSWKLSGQTITTPVFEGEATFGDFTGDGLVDVQYTNDQSRLVMRELVRDTRQVESSSRYYTFGPPVQLNWIDVPTAERMFYVVTEAGAADFNGDGRVDAMSVAALEHCS